MTLSVKSPCIDVLSLPDTLATEMDFYDTSFFQRSKGQWPLPQLPSPSEIVQQYPVLGDGGRGIAKFEHLNLIAKADHSSHLRLEEALTLRAIRQAFPDGEVPVPEVFGWRKFGRSNFIYMSLVTGKTLREVWASLTTADKASIRDQLARIVAALRRITQKDSPNCFIGSINKGPVQDRYFKDDYEEGPFPDIKSFNDWVGFAATRRRPGPGELVEQDICRDYLPNTGNIYFTHGDLTLGNILISEGEEKKIVGIVDWEQAGWYPEYWEYCKLLYGVDYEHGWRSEGWADGVMRPFQDEWEAFMEYNTWRGHP